VAYVYPSIIPDAMGRVNPSDSPWSKNREDPVLWLEQRGGGVPRLGALISNGSTSQILRVPQPHIVSTAPLARVTQTALLDAILRRGA
jgi:hypothetical protein